VFRRIATPLFAMLLSIAACTFSQAQTMRTGSDVRGLFSPSGLPQTHRAVRASAAQRTNPEPDAVALGLAQSKTYAFTTVDYPGTAYSIVLDTNASTAVGAMAYDGFTSRAFTLKGSKYTTLAVPGSSVSWASGINTSGQITGVYADVSGNYHGFLGISGSFTTIDYPGALATFAEGINDSGQIVGLHSDGTSEDGFLYKSGTMTNIHFPGSVWTLAFGISSSGNVSHGFLLKGGTFTSLDFPQASFTTAWGINDSGVIAGTYKDGGGLQHGFTYSTGTYTKADVVGAAESALYRIKNNGTVVGEYVDSLGESHGIKGK
jgi:probable HAF family extracellular repeat protein